MQVDTPEGNIVDLVVDDVTNSGSRAAGTLPADRFLAGWDATSSLARFRVARREWAQGDPENAA